MSAKASRRTLVALAASLVLVGSVARVSVAADGPEPRDDEGSRQITFTKWVVGAGPQMAGFTGGAAVGDFTGEILSLTRTSTSPFVALIYSIEAVYDIHAGSRSFTALIKGGENAAGKAFLDGRVIAGWQIGSPVHVTFQGETDCTDAPAGPCFVGTITISPDSERD